MGQRAQLSCRLFLVLSGSADRADDGPLDTVNGMDSVPEFLQRLFYFTDLLTRSLFTNNNDHALTPCSETYY